MHDVRVVAALQTSSQMTRKWPKSLFWEHVAKVVKNPKNSENFRQLQRVVETLPEVEKHRIGRKSKSEMFLSLIAMSVGQHYVLGVSEKNSKRGRFGLKMG